MIRHVGLVGFGFIAVGALVALMASVARRPVGQLETDATPSFAIDDLLLADRPFPQPIDDLFLSLGAKTDNKHRRKAWIKERHRAAPGTDWEAIEARNGLDQIRKRNELARIAGQGGPHGGQPLAGSLHWVERGSDNQAGRMHVARHSSDGSRIYAGSSLGGIWVGELDGTDWVPIGDNLFGGAHELAVLPPDEPGGPDVVLAVTDGGRIHRSADDGQTWVVPEGVGEPNGCRRVLTTSEGSHTVFVVLQYGDTVALLRSTDRAQGFEQVFDLGDYRGDVWAPRDGGAGIYLLAGGTTIHRSEDNGDSWAEIGSLGVGGNSGELVGSEAGAPRLWSVVRVDNQRQLYRSDDAGASWSYVTDVHDYWRSLGASIKDADVFAWGGVEVYRTADGGQSFAITNSWIDYYDEPDIRLHADVPGIDVTLDVDGEEIWYVSTDGGLYRSVDRLATVENLSLDGLRVSQYYSTLTSVDDPSQVAAGSQDQGFQITTFLEQDDGLYEFDQLVSGDYGHVTSHDGSHDWVYTTYPGILLAYWGTYATPVIFSIEFPPDERYAWLPPIKADPLVEEALFFPATRLYRYLRQGAVWEPEIWSELAVDEDDEDEYISAIEFSPVDPERAYLATNRGRLFYSDDRAVTFTESDSPGPSPHYFYGTALVASSLDVDTVFVGGSGYEGPAVFVSNDGGETFAPFDEGLPDTLVYCLAEAGDGSGGLYAGTETSAYRRDADWDEWVDIAGNVAPVTIYWSVEAVPAEGAMRFGTYGRGIWDYRIDPTIIDVADGGPDDTDGGVPASGQEFVAMGGGCTCGSAPGRGVSPHGGLLLSGLLLLVVGLSCDGGPKR